MQWLESAETTKVKGQSVKPAPQDSKASRVSVFLVPASSRPGRTGGLIVSACPDPNMLDP